MGWTPNNGTRFDAETFKKLVARFDSNHTGEAETAFRKAMLICVQAQMRFCDAATEAYSQSDRVIELETELESVRELLSQRERQGAALADARDKLEQEFSSFRREAEREVTRLRRNAAPTSGTYCRACEWKHAALAVFSGWPLAKLWFWAGGSLPTLDSATAGSWWGVLLIASPLFAVLGRWRWLGFKQTHAWRSWRDNHLFRRVAARWNAFLKRLILT